MVIGLTAGLDACSACSSSPGGRTNCFSYFIILSHKLTYASSDGGSLGGEIHLVNHHNPLRVRSTFTVIQCTVRGTVYYKVGHNNHSSCKLNSTLKDYLTPFYISNEVSREYIHHHVTVAL